MDMKRFFLYAIVIAALAVAGCGGNGGGQTAMPDPDPDPDPVTCPDGYTGTPPNCVAPPPAPSNDSFPGTDTEAMNAIFLPMKDGSAGALNDDRRPTATVSVEAGGAAGTTTVDGDVLNKDDEGIKDAEEFGAVSDAVRATLDEFSNVMVQTRTIETTTDTVTIYSDVKGLKNEKYLTYFSDSNSGSDPKNRPTIVRQMNQGANPPSDLTGQGILTIDNDSDNNNTIIVPSKYASLFESSAFPTDEDQTYTYENDDPSQTGDQSKRGGRTLEGSFTGVSGNFVCTGTVCSATTDSKGILSQLTGTWTFVPDDVKGYVRDIIPDLDYLSFGYWLQNDDGDYSVNVFYAGSMPFVVGDGTVGAGGIQNLVGSATYTGEATGFYVKKTFDAGANDFVPTNSGQFTADAKLTARFGGPEFGVDSNFEIDGEVMNFRDGASGDMIDSMWSVELKDALFYNGTTYANTFNGNTSTGTGSTPGQWEGGFFGPTVTDDSATTTIDESVSGYPTGVAGEFNAHFSPGGGQDPGHVIGGFGATR